MSFRCEKCDKAQAPGTRPIKRVPHVRLRADEKRTHTLPNGTVIDMHGAETVFEMDLCSPCAETVPDAMALYRATRDAEIGFKNAPRSR